MATFSGTRASLSLMPIGGLACLASHGIPEQDLTKDRAHIETDVAFVPEAELAALLDEAGLATPVRFCQACLFGGWFATKRV